ncbi:MAG: hypothetical protein P9L94_15010 [Candidatus Hinthialibacter antarcticus]|nr:hypothetical protein [Candidatus Hinthialibacter antarcticus]
MVKFLIQILCVIGLGLVPAAQEEPASQLYSQGNTSFATGDYVAASYYFQRLHDSEQWEAFPQKVDVLGKLGMVEEGQSRFGAAASWYRQVIVELEAKAPQQIDAFAQYYVLRYAECLERSGAYPQAAKILWEQYARSEPVLQPTILHRILRNAQYKELGEDELRALRAEVEANGLSNLGWNLADLYQRNQRFNEAFSLYEELWPNAPANARNHLDAMITTYQAADKLDGWLDQLQQAVDEGVNPNQFILLETEILRSLDRGEEALNRMETALSKLAGVPNLNDIASLAGKAPSSLIQHWLELVQLYRGEADALVLLQTWVNNQPNDILLRGKLAEWTANAGKLDEAGELWLSWARDRDSDSASILLAAENLIELGANDAARQLLAEQQANLDPKFAMRFGQLAMRVNQFQQAIDAFNTATVKVQTPAIVISDAVLTYADSAPDADALFGALIGSVSGEPFSALPAWSRTAVQELGFRRNRMNTLRDMALAEPSGAWRIELARAASQQGEQDWALELLDQIADDSPYRNTAKREKALLLGNSILVPRKVEAVQLMQSSLEAVLSATSEIPLTHIMVERMLTYSEYSLDAFLPNDALRAIVRVESASNELAQPMPPINQERLRFLRARAMMELGSWTRALEMYQTITLPPYSTDARFYEALIFLGLEQTEEAKAAMQELLDQPEHWRRANDALAYLTALEPLVGEPLEWLCKAQLFELQGRLMEAAPFYRQIAVAQYGEDTEEWARYVIGDLERISGQWSAARQEWERLALDVDHPVIHAMIRWELWRAAVADDAVAAATGFQNLLMDFPDSLAADLARLEFQKRSQSNNP